MALPCFGQWNKTTVKEIQNYEKNVLHSDRGDYVSFAAGLIRSFNSGDLEGEIFEINYLNKKIPYYLRVTNQSQKLKVYFPGIFGSFEERMSRYFIESLEASGENVLVIPNFLSIDYLESGIVNQEHSMDIDIQVALKIINKIITEKKIESIDLFGESLGGFLVAAVAPKIKKLKFNRVTILWGPSSLKIAQEKLDKKIKFTKERINQCYVVISILKFYYAYYFDNLKKIAEKDIKCLENYLFNGVFLKSLKKSEKSLGKDLKKSSSSFKEFFEVYLPFISNQIKRDDKRLKMEYWLVQIPFYFTTRVLNSRNDFLFDRNSLPFESCVLLDGGGHCGLINSKKVLKSLIKY